MWDGVHIDLHSPLFACSEVTNFHTAAHDELESRDLNGQVGLRLQRTLQSSTQVRVLFIQSPLYGHRWLTALVPTISKLWKVRQLNI